MKLIGLASLLVTTCASAAVYKWTDSSGTLIFGDIPPSGVNAVKIEAYGQGEPEPDVSVALRERLEKAEAESLIHHGDAEQVNCSKAVGHAQLMISSMMEGNEFNFQQGVFKQKEYEKNGQDLQKLQEKVSVSECLTSFGNRKSFYLCMSNDKNHLSACGKRYGYGV